MTADLFASADSTGALLAQLAGAASTCWSDLPAAGTFDTDQAVLFVTAALARLEELQGEQP